MNGLRCCLGLVFAFALAMPSAPAQAQAPQATAARKIDLTTAVNLAGRQRMLSQRMVKAYLMLGQGISPVEARNQLQESVRQFESQLATLKTLQPTPMVRRAVDALEDAWLECRPLLVLAPNKADAIELYDASEALQKAAHSAVLAYEAIGSTPHNHLVSIAGRQRMLSQRMAKYYLYRSWGLYDAAADMELHLSRAHFTAVLNALEESPLASTQMKARVAQVRNDWQPYQEALFASTEAGEMRANAVRVAELSERVLARAEELVAQLVTEALAARP